MAEINVSTFNTPQREKKEPSKISFGMSKKDFFTLIAGFFLAMAMPYGGVAPFGLSFLARYRKLSVKAVVSLISVSLGAMAVCDRLGTAKYVCAGLVYLSVLFVLERGVGLNAFTAGIAAGGSVLLAGLVTLFWEGFSFSQMGILVCETAAVVAGARVFEKCSGLLERGRLVPESISAEEKVSLGAVAAIVILSLREIYIGTDFSVMNMVATAVLLVVAAGCGPGYSTGAGVILGLVCGTGTDYFLPILGAFSFCGFLSGLFSRFGKGGVIAGVALANGMLIVYTNGAMESVLNLYEIMAASVLFCFVKTRYIGLAGAVFCLDAEEKAGIKRMKEGLKSRLAEVAASFEDMAKTLERLSDKHKEQNNADIAVVFDMAADKVCRDCRKASICWSKDFDFTYHALFGMMEAMSEKGIILPEDAEERFRTRCLNLHGLVTELNHQLDIHRMDCVWQSRLRESRELVGEQLSGMSRILDGISEEIESDIRFDSLTARDIAAELEKRDIKFLGLEVYCEKNGRHRVELKVKSTCWIGIQKDAVKKIMKKIFDGEIRMTEVFSENGKFVDVEITDAERFRVEADFAEKAASDENGDNYRFSHISGGKYVVALSDGMGTGSRASRESEAMLELLDSFLRAGFDSRMAVKFINSVMLLKSDDDAFVTIDICIIDLYTGEAEFIKTGAEPSFILQNGGVGTVKAASLPVGVIADMEAETSSMLMDDGDVIVMVTDGIESRDGGSMWIGEFIEENCRHEEDKGLADKILKRAIEKNNGEINDDMTVLSVRLKAVS